MGKRKLFNHGNLGNWGKRRKTQGEDNGDTTRISQTSPSNVAIPPHTAAIPPLGVAIGDVFNTTVMLPHHVAIPSSPHSMATRDTTGVCPTSPHYASIPPLGAEPILPASVEEENNEGEDRHHEPEEESETRGKFTPPPTIESAKAALTDIKVILNPMRKSGKGHKDPGLDLLLRKRLEAMQMFLWGYSDTESTDAGHHGSIRSKWTAASTRTAHALEKGPHFARNLRKWTHAFIADREELPENPYGQWSVSLIDDEDLAQEIHLHLQGLGKYIKSLDIVHFLDTPEMLERLKREKTVSLTTAQRWLERNGFRWTKDPKGQFVDGHERDDVVRYRQEIFLPAFADIEARTRKWTQEGQQPNEPMPAPGGKRAVVWFHDESTFYANDRRKQRWVHKSETAVPYAKGEGASLMVADFVSADYRWLRSPDGLEVAQVLFRAGKARDGYFTNDDIVSQARKAMDILEKHFPDEDHVFVFDNATTHLKRADGALSARRMPKGISKPGTNFGVEVSVFGDDGKLIYGRDGKVVKEKVPMVNGMFRDGSEQQFYFPEGHEHAGLFKGMAIILEERGIEGISGPKGKKAQCGKNFSCKPGANDCCCRRILYNQPDFINVESILETVCKARGVKVLFLPKFHCELNFIEQCWGFAKRRYRLLPPSSKEDDLEKNLIASLEDVSVIQMRRSAILLISDDFPYKIDCMPLLPRRFATRSCRFMDAYRKGLNGKQAAWASKRYRGHRMIPESIFSELDKAQIA
jgi:hypothetical protein